MMTHTGYDSTQTQTKILVLYTAFIVLSYLDSSWVTFDHLVDSGQEIWPLLGHFWPFQNSILQQYQNIFDRREITSHIFLKPNSKKTWYSGTFLALWQHCATTNTPTSIVEDPVRWPGHPDPRSLTITNGSLFEFGAFTEFLISLSKFLFPRSCTLYRAYYQYCTVSALLFFRLKYFFVFQYFKLPFHFEMLRYRFVK